MLADRRFRLYFLARTSSTFGNVFGTLAVTFGVLAVGSARDLGFVLAATAVPALALMLLGGVAGDRLERRSILIAADLVMAATQGVAALLFFLDAYNVAVIAGLQLMRGVANAFFHPASTGMLPTVVEPNELQAANAFLGLSRSVAAIIAPAAAGGLIALTSPAFALTVDALTFLVSALLVSRLPRSRGRIQAGVSILADLRVGWREFVSRRWAWQMVTSFSIYQGTVLPCILLAGPALFDQRGLGAAGWAVVLAARAAGSLLAGVLLLRWRFRRPLMTSALVILLDLPLLLALAMGAPIFVIAGVGFFSAIGLVTSDDLWQTALQTQVPEESLSRVSSYDWLGSLAMNPLGMVVVGIVVSSGHGKTLLFVVAAVHLTVHVSLLLSRSIHRSDREFAKLQGQSAG